jgi:hypothetical protein
MLSLNAVAIPNSVETLTKGGHTVKSHPLLLEEVVCSNSILRLLTISIGFQFNNVL